MEKMAVHIYSDWIAETAMPRADSSVNLPEFSD
jgi:hypothetical protein